MRKYRIVAAAIIVIVLIVSVYFLIPDHKQSLVVYSADAYVGEVNALISGFHNSTGLAGDTSIGGGSFTIGHEIGNGIPANIFFSVSRSAYSHQYLGSKYYSGWAVALAGDSLVLAYSGSHLNAADASLINNFSTAYRSNNTSLFANAFGSLTSGTFKVGISNASSDPAGLRAYISLEIAGYLYSGGNESYYIHRLASNDGLVSASSAADLVAPLETGQVSFLYIYKSAAISKGLDYITLPDRLNFGNYSMASFYSNFSYQTQTGVIHGFPVYLYVSIPANESLVSESQKFVEYSMENRYLLADFGMITMDKPMIFYNNTPPSFLSQYIKNESLLYGGNM